METNNKQNKTQMMDDRQLDALYAAWRDDRNQVNSTPLKQWIENFPAFREHLMQWTTDEPLMVGADPTVAPEAEARALAIGREVVAARLSRRQAKPAAAITSLYAAAKQQGLTPKSLASALEVGLPIIAKLQQRLLNYQSIPARFLERLALELRVSREQLRDYLTRPASLAAGAMYRSSGVPQAGEQEDFAQAIRSCPDMSAEQKQAWLTQTRKIEL